MIRTIFKSKFTYWIVFLYLLILAWWIRLQVTGTVGKDEALYYDWAYGVIGLSTAIYGLIIAFKTWGGFSSLLGKSLIFLALGLLGQWFGLQVWTYYNVIAEIEVPYPSLADLGYFALIPAYTIAALNFSLASGAKLSLGTIKGKLYALIIPISALTLAYGLFLKDIGFDISNPIKLFLDIGYPLGEIIPVSIAVFTLLISRNLNGGVMKNRVLYLIGAFTFQFLTEYTFLYMVGNSTYVNGGLADILYPTSYTIMSFGLIAFSNLET